MGIDSDEDDYGPDCPACFPLGEAPRVMYATFTGIKFGNNWSAGDGQCPNGTIKLIGGGFCGWTYTSGLDDCSYSSFGGTAELHYTRDFVGTLFSNFGGPECVYFFANQSTSPIGSRFWDGLCSIHYVTPQTGPSIQRVMSALNIEPHPKTFAEVFPVEKGQSIYRIARKKDATNALIRFDYD